MGLGHAEADREREVGRERKRCGGVRVRCAVWEGQAHDAGGRVARDERVPTVRPDEGGELQVERFDLRAVER